jgi:hypothetical protein
MQIRKLLGLALIVVPLAVIAQQAPAPSAAKPADAAKKYSFKTIDASGDKKISREEAKKSGISDEDFSRWDKDKSGFITWDEVSKDWSA